MKRYFVTFILISFVLAYFVFAQPGARQRPRKERFGTYQYLPLKQTIDINLLRLGSNFPNLLKGMYISVDENTGNVYLAGIKTHYICEASPDTGKVLRVFDTGLGVGNYAIMHVEPVSHTLFYVTMQGSVVSFDLGTGTKKGEYSYSESTQQQPIQKERFPNEGLPQEGTKMPGRDSEKKPRQKMIEMGSTEEIGGRSGRKMVGREPIPGKTEDMSKKGVKGGKMVFPVALIDKTTNTLLAICTQDSNIYVFNDRASLVKKITTNGTVLYLHWSDLYNGVIVSLYQEGVGLRFALLNVNEGTTKDLLSIQREKHEKVFVMDEKGNYYLLGRSLSKIDKSGKELWHVSIGKEPAEGMIYHSGSIALLFRDGHAGKNEGGKPSCVDFYNSENGGFLGTQQMKFEAQHMVLDKPHNRLLVGNGGDASFSVVDWSSKKIINTYRVGSAVEQVIYDKDTGNVYILNRLGGSEIYRYNLTTNKFDTLIAGSWPVDMAFSPTRKRLFVMSHYEAKIYVVDTNTFTVVDEIPLGIIGSKTDTLSYLAYNDKTGILSACFPETADLVILNVDTKSIIKIKPSGSMPLLDKGPGQWHIQISGDGRYILLHISESGKLIQYDTKGNEIDSIQISLDTGKGYTQDVFRALPSTGALYLCSYPVNLNPLGVGTPNRLINRVLDISDNILYGNRIDKNGEEFLTLIDVNTGAPVSMYKINKDTTIPSACYFDINTGIYFVTDMTMAKVYLFEIPQVKSLHPNRAP